MYLQPPYSALWVVVKHKDFAARHWCFSSTIFRFCSILNTATAIKASSLCMLQPGDPLSIAVEGPPQVVFGFTRQPWKRSSFRSIKALYRWLVSLILIPHLAGFRTQIRRGHWVAKAGKPCWFIFRTQALGISLTLASGFGETASRNCRAPFDQWYAGSRSPNSLTSVR